MNNKDHIIAELQSTYQHGLWHAQLGVEQDFHCTYCDVDLLSSYDLYRSTELDHIIPDSEDGENDIANRATCCRTCNMLKRNYLPVGDTRTARIDDSRRFITEARERHEAKLTRLRDLVRGPK